jgi:hypothetical protein
MKGLARLAFLGGAAALGLLLFRAAPHEVTLVYAGAAPATVLEVDIARDGEAVRRAELRFPGGAPPQVTHRVRLTDGDYTVRLRLSGAQGARTVERSIHVAEAGAIVLAVGP